MKISKVLIATIIVSIFNLIVSMLTCGGFFNWVYKLEPTNVWKPMENFPFILMVLELLIVNFIFVCVYALIHKGIPVKGKVLKGFVYGLIVWAVGMIPGMLATVLYMTVATGVVIYWTISALIILPLKGLITSAIYGEE